MTDIADALINGELFEADNQDMDGLEDNEGYRWMLKGIEVTLIMNFDRSLIITAYQTIWKETRYDKRKQYVYTKY